mmetsp:Transcript_2406/g.4029  ORF Transcript_2406/g.4029 Transcript_2406/m.4029 type:complete len:115 (+) Transcript_2406:436-780(+)
MWSFGPMGQGKTTTMWGSPDNGEALIPRSLMCVHPHARTEQDHRFLLPFNAALLLLLLVSPCFSYRQVFDIMSGLVGPLKPQIRKKGSFNEGPKVRAVEVDSGFVWRHDPVHAL